MTCEVCDREGCPLPAARERLRAVSGGRLSMERIDAATAHMEAAANCAAHAVNWRDLAITGRGREAELTAEVERLRDALTTISGIRDSIVGAQKFNFSEHAYPLVAALDGAGFKGVGYEIAAANLGTLIEQRDRAERDLAAARADAANARAVATEAIEIADSLVTIAKRGYVLRGRVANLATLRARLASPAPAKET